MLLFVIDHIFSLVISISLSLLVNPLYRERLSTMGLTCDYSRYRHSAYCHFIPLPLTLLTFILKEAVLPMFPSKITSRNALFKVI